ncbi:MAG: 50S ribosomal protein L20 [Anaerolineae bacterium]|nr:50S ribosomal protein L20 [Anaerolineae bacterium]
MRVKGGTRTKYRHKKILKQNKGYYGTRSRLWRRANEAWLKAQWYAYRDRRQRRRVIRSLWITRINAAARTHNVSYSRFMHGLKQAGVVLNRKVLADIAVRDASTFAQLAELAKAHQ